MAVPALTTRIDWFGTGDFAAAIDTVHPLDQQPMTISRGRSGDFSADTIGQCSFVLDNSDFAYSEDRNWCDNPSFEVDASGWSAAATGLTSAATSIAQIGTDNAPNAGTHCGQAVIPAAVGAGVSFASPYVFRSGQAYTLAVYLRSVSGSTSIVLGIGSNGTPADAATASLAITTGWARYSVTWTPAVDRSDAVLWIAAGTGAAATVNIDAVGLNPGSSANAYLEAPTRGQLTGGVYVHLEATYASVTYPLFYGRVQRFTPDPANRLMTVLAYDTLKRYDETNVAVGGLTTQGWTGRDTRLAVLDQVERGSFNLLPNPEFATNTANWMPLGSATITRVATDGPLTTTTCGEMTGPANGNVVAMALLTPIAIAGQWHQASVYLRCPGTLKPVTLTLSTGAGESSAVTVTPTGAWARYNVNLYAPSTRTYPYTPTLTVAVPSGGTVRIGAAAVTSGSGLYPYSATGTGRPPNLCLQGSFDAGLLSGWYDGFSNLVGNPSFEVNTVGWSTSNDSFYSGGGAITRVTSGGAFGACYGAFTAGGWYDLSGMTFQAGATYVIGIAINGLTTGGTNLTQVTIGSNGTPTDKAVSASLGLSSNVWARLYGQVNYALVWTPLANRTDVHLAIAAASGTMGVDGVFVARLDASTTNKPYYSDVGPVGAAMVGPTARATSSASVKYGSQSQSITNPATALAGRLYDFSHSGAYFVAGRAYTAYAWVTCDSGSAPVTVTIGANEQNGTWETASASAIVTAGTFTQIVVHWTPAANYSSTNPYDVVLAVYQTDATARTLYVDGVRVIAQSTADDAEMAQWNVAVGAEADDSYASTLSLAGTALALLQGLNAWTLTRHFLSALGASPWYQYNTIDRNVAPSLVETFRSADGTAPVSLTGVERDRDAIVNVVQAVYGTVATQVLYSDADSVAQFGEHPYSQTIGTGWLSDRSAIDVMGPQLIARYADGPRRPQMVVENHWPSQCQRDIGDLIEVSIDPWDVQAIYAVIERIDLRIDQAGQKWAATYQLEEYLPAIAPASVPGDLARAMPE